VWLQDVLDAKFGKGDTRVICPITDAFVAHHGALGGFVRVWCTGKATPAQVMDAIRPLAGIESVLDKGTACRVHDLPADREADVVVISTAEVCIGASEKDHDLSGLEGHRLRTHGGVTEAKVPIIISRPLNGAYRLRGGAGILKSYELFDFALNGVAP
jgi:phosphonoacetate hydrolase